MRPSTTPAATASATNSSKQYFLSTTRASGIPARIGGDSSRSSPDTSIRPRTLKIRLAKRLEAIDVIDRNALQLKANAAFGVAGYPSAGESVDEIIAQADADMYADKREYKSERNGNGVAALRLEQGESAG
jgi:GGDEF domain-containing protein